MEEENKKIEIIINPDTKVDLDDDCILPLETNDEDTMDLSDIVASVKEKEGDKSE